MPDPDLSQSLRTSKEYRHAFVEETIRAGIAAQIKAMRERMRDMTQKKFGELLGNKSQSWVARLEDPNAARPTLSTLLSVAEACDVCLQVRFAPFSEFINWVSGIPHWVLGLSPPALAVSDFCHDAGLLEHKAPMVAATSTGSETTQSQTITSTGFVESRTAYA